MFLSKPTIVKIQGSVSWTYAYDPASGTYVGVCPALSLNAMGETWSELAESADECTSLLFSALLERGELDAFLRRHGWRQESARPVAASDKVRFDIPLELVAQENPAALLTA